MKFFTAILSALALAVSTTSATAIAARAGAPKITRPYQGEPWFNLGLQPIIEWDTAGLEQDNSTCTLLLGYVDDNCSCSLRNFDDESDCQHLDWQHPLALNLPVALGNVTVKVPHVSFGNTYFVVLVTDFGITRSAEFVITTPG